MMNYLKEYDETDPISIETYAKQLIGKTFVDVCKQDDITKATSPASGAACPPSAAPVS